MRSLEIDVFETELNKKRAKFRNSILWLLNRVNVELMLAGKVSADASEGKCTLVQIHSVSALIMDALATGANISKLLEPLSICSKDALPLSRTFFETCLNAAFLLTDAGSRAERARLYSVYRQFLDRSQHYKFGSESGLIQDNLTFSKNDQIVQQAHAIFKSKKRGEIRPCFEESRAEIISAISLVSPGASILFNGVEKMSWKLSSEIAHGSLYAHHRLQDFSGLPKDKSIESHIVAPANHGLVLSSNALAHVIECKKFNCPSLPALIEACKMYYSDENPEWSE